MHQMDKAAFACIVYRLEFGKRDEGINELMDTTLLNYKVT